MYIRVPIAAKLTTLELFSIARFLLHNFKKFFLAQLHFSLAAIGSSHFAILFWCVCVCVLGGGGVTIWPAPRDRSLERLGQVAVVKCQVLSHKYMYMYMYMYML